MTDWIVTPRDAGKRLDVFLKEKLSARSRAFLQSRIKEGAAHVSGARKHAAARLRAGERVTFIGGGQRRMILTPQADVPVAIIAERGGVIAINKPAGIAAHPATLEGVGTVANWVASRIPGARSVGGDPRRPGIVHRLDRYTSGVMVIARTQGIFEHLKACFAARRVAKEYIALVEGTPQDPRGVVEGLVVRSPKRHDQRRLMTLPLASGARSSRSRYTIEHAGKTVSMVRFFPETGRTHQIRLHAKALGTPVLGDRAYGARFTLPQELSHRFYLHAKRIAFPLPDGTEAVFSAPLPPEFAQAWKWFEGAGHKNAAVL